MTAIFSWVNNFAFNSYSRPSLVDPEITAKYSKCQTSFYSMQVSLRFYSLRCSEILVSPSICIKIRTWRFHRTEEVSNNFPVSWHITHISMAISANLGRDTDHNFTKLVCDHPLFWSSKKTSDPVNKKTADPGKLMTVHLREKQSRQCINFDQKCWQN